MANEHEHGGGLPHLVCAHKGKVVMGTNHYRYQHLLESDASFPAHRGTSKSGMGGPYLGRSIRWAHTVNGSDCMRRHVAHAASVPAYKRKTPRRVGRRTDAV
ncbi:unnamed protein product [Musa hybrid cultivar]